MASISSLPASTGVHAADVFPVDNLTDNVTQKVTASALLPALAAVTPQSVLDTLYRNDPTGANHRTFFGGKNLGDTVTAEQLAAIKNGTFAGLLVGDYWRIDEKNWRIVDMDYWYNTGDALLSKHHLVIMPDSNILSDVFNDTNTTAGGYMGSKLYTTAMPDVIAICRASFPDLVLSHREYLTTAVTNGVPTAGAWANSEAEIPTEIMMYGTTICSPANNGTGVAYLSTIDRTQLAAFRLAPQYIRASMWFWLRDIAGSSSVCISSDKGNASTISTTNSGGIRPVFAIG